MPTDSVTARPSRFWLVPGLFPVLLGLNGLFFRSFVGGRPSDVDWVMPVMGAVLLSFGVLSTLHFAREQLSVNAEALSRRQFFVREVRPWSDVADYYTNAPGGPCDRANTIRFCDGKTWAFGSEWVNSAELRHRIQTFAPVRERIGDWAQITTRQCDQPQTFLYSPKTIQSERVETKVLSVLFVMAGIAGAYFLYDVFNSGYLSGAIMTIVVLPLMLLLAFSIRNQKARYRAAVTRAMQSITTDVEGFTFSTGKETVFVEWHDVIGYDFSATDAGAEISFRPQKPAVQRIRTAQGQEFEFTRLLDPNRSLRQIVRRFAVNGHETKIDRNQREALGGIAAQWTGEEEGKGDRLFSAWTRSNRARISLFPIFVCLITFTEIGLSAVALSDASILVCVALSLASISICLLAATTLKAIRLQVGADVIISHSPWGRREIRYRDIVRCETDGTILTLHISDGKALRFDTAYRCNGSQIEPLIVERLRRSTEV